MSEDRLNSMVFLHVQQEQLNTIYTIRNIKKIPKKILGKN